MDDPGTSSMNSSASKEDDSLSRTPNVDQELAQDEPDVLDWDGPNDPESPYNWSPVRKWLVAGLAIVAPLICSVNGTSVTVAASAINDEFNVSDENFPNSYWPVFSWTLGGAAFVPVFLPLMEDLGIRTVFLAFYCFFILMIIPQAVAPNFATLIVTRFLSGGSSALLANTISSIIPDLWETDRGRSLPVALYILSYLVGSTAGPVLFAGVMQHIGNWRWIFYIQLIIYGSFLPIFALFLRETRPQIILDRRAKKLRKATRSSRKNVYAPGGPHPTLFANRFFQSTTRPAYLLLTEPVLFAATIWSGFSFGLVYLFTQSITQVFETNYNWPEYRTGYILGSVVVGEVLGFLASFYGSRLYFQSASWNKECAGRPIPEARLYVSVPASLLGLVGGMFIYAWTSYPNIHWIAPTMGLAMVGFGIQVVVSAVADYVTDLYSASSFAGSAISAVASVENIFAGALPLAEMKMYTRLGFQWASTLLALLGLILSLAPVVFIWKGRQLRQRSPFMSAGEQANVQ